MPLFGIVSALRIFVGRPPGEVSLRTMTPFIPWVHKEENACSIDLFVSFIQITTAQTTGLRVEG